MRFVSKLSASLSLKPLLQTRTLVLPIDFSNVQTSGGNKCLSVVYLSVLWVSRFSVVEIAETCSSLGVLSFSFLNTVKGKNTPNFK